MGFAMVNDRYLLNQESLGWLLLIALVVLGRASACGIPGPPTSRASP
jgi:hypothetical protein